VELLPGAIMSYQALSAPAVSFVLPSVSIPRLTDYWMRVFETEDSFKILVRGASLLVRVILWAPTLAYRWALKGTALIYLPILWLVWDAPKSKPEYIVESAVVKGALCWALSVAVIGIGRFLSWSIGSDLGILGLYESAATKGASSKTAAEFFPLHGTPAWQAAALVAAALVIFGFAYAVRLKNRGYGAPQQRILELLYFGVGCALVTTIYAVLITATSLVARS
jgi:hypothetical protein